MIYLLLILQFAFASLSNIDKAQIPSFNVLKNGGFESGKANWTASGGTFSTAVRDSADDFGFDYVYATWDSDSGDQTLSFSSIEIPAGYYGTNGEAFCYFSVPSGTGTHKLQVTDGTNVISEQEIRSTTGSAKVGTNFVFPSSGSIVLRAISVASNEPSVSVDGCYLGPATNVGTVAQAKYIGYAYFDPANATGDCEFSTTSTSTAAFSPDSDCPGPTVVDSVVGDWQTTDANLPRVTINNLPPAWYCGRFDGVAGVSGGSPVMSFAINSGGQTKGQGVPPTVNFSAGGFSVEACFEHTGGNRSFELYAKVSSNTGLLYMNANGRNLAFTLKSFPLSSQQVYTTDQSDYGWRSATYTGTWLTNATYAGFERKIGDSMELTFSISLGGAPTSTALAINIPNSEAIDDDKLSFVNNIAAVGSCEITDIGSNVSYSAIAVVQSGLNRILLRGTAGAESNVTQAVPITFASGDSITCYAKVPIEGWATTNRAPQLVNSILNSESPYVQNKIDANINCDSSSAITSQNGGIASVGNRSTTSCALTIESGFFSATPFKCSVTINGTSPEATSCACASATSCTIYGPNSDYDAFVNIEGPK